MDTDSTPNRPSDKPDVDSLIADLFGLNIRGARTLFDLVLRPRSVFDSARIFDWQSRYTPTLRLAFSLLTVFALLSFFWAAEDSPLYQGLLAEIMAAQTDNPDAPPPRDVVDAIFAGFSFAFPFAYMLIHSLAGAIVFVWGTGTPWVARIRLYFSVLCIGLGLSVLSMILLPLFGPETVNIYSAVGMTAGTFAYAVTYARGTSPHHRGLALWWRSVFLAVMMTVTDLLVAVVASFAGTVWAQRLLG